MNSSTLVGSWVAPARGTRLVHALGVALMGAIALGTGAAVVVPTLMERGAEALAQSRLDERTSEHQQLLARQRGLVEEQRRLREELRTLVDLQPQSMINSRLERLTRRAEAAGLTITSLAPGVAQRVAPTHAIVPIRLGGQAGYPQMVAFIAALRTDFPDVSVAGLELRALPERPDKPADYELSLHWYALPEGQAQQSARAASTLAIPAVATGPSD